MQESILIKTYVLLRICRRTMELIRQNGIRNGSLEGLPPLRRWSFSTTRAPALSSEMKLQPLMSSFIRKSWTPSIVTRLTSLLFLMFVEFWKICNKSRSFKMLTQKSKRISIDFWNIKNGIDWHLWVVIKKLLSLTKFAAKLLPVTEGKSVLDCYILLL